MYKIGQWSKEAVESSLLQSPAQSGRPEVQKTAYRYNWQPIKPLEITRMHQRDGQGQHARVRKPDRPASIDCGGRPTWANDGGYDGGLRPCELTRATGLIDDWMGRKWDRCVSFLITLRQAHILHVPDRSSYRIRGVDVCRGYVWVKPILSACNGDVSRIMDFLLIFRFPW